MAEREGLLDRSRRCHSRWPPIDWGSAESRADELERSLLDPPQTTGRLLPTFIVVRRFALNRSGPFPAAERLSDEPESDGDRITDLAARFVGVYRLIEPLGRGGMGEVYLGERADGRFEQKVAVKLVKRGMDSRRDPAPFRA